MKCPTCGKRTLANIGVCKHCGDRIPRSKITRGLKLPKMISLFARLSPPQRFGAGVGVLGMLIVILVLIVLPLRGKKGRVARPEFLGQEITIEKITSGREIAAHAVYGRLIGSHVDEEHEGQIIVKSLHTGEIYTFGVGWHTSYHPRRYPFMGEQVKVYYHNAEGIMKATQVQIGR